MGTVTAPYSDRDIVGVEPNDHDLVAAVRCGDDRAFEQLFERYQRRIAAYVYGMVSDHGRAEDITQEIFISALRRMRETERPIAFKPWIYEIAKNACIDQFRRSKRSEEVSYDGEEGLGAADYGRLAQRGPSPDVAVDQKQALHDLCGAFGGLSETHHQILVLRELEGLSYREIGDRLGMSRPSVESTLFRARRRLTEEYDELASGQRCIRVQALIGTAADGLLGARDTRRLARHLSHCQPCRKQARAAGVDGAVMARRPSRRELVGARIAGLLPFPALVRGRRSAEPDAVLSSSPGQGLWNHWTAMGTMHEPLVTGWSKAAAAAATLVLAGVGAEVGSRVAGPESRAADRSGESRSNADRSTSTRSSDGSDGSGGPAAPGSGRAAAAAARADARPPRGAIRVRDRRATVPATARRPKVRNTGDAPPSATAPASPPAGERAEQPPTGPVAPSAPAAPAAPVDAGSKDTVLQTSRPDKAPSGPSHLTIPSSSGPSGAATPSGEPDKVLPQAGTGLETKVSELQAGAGR